MIETGLDIQEGLLFDSSHDVSGASVPRAFTGEVPNLRETKLGFPQLSELEVVRHFTRLSRKNFNIDLGMYPLGSCTMKYNPRVNETISGLGGFSMLHPYQPESMTQGALSILYDLEQALAELTGLAAVTLSPAAGAHGEFVGLKLIKAYLEHHNLSHKNIILIPDTAHGTNPASCIAAGFQVKSLPEGANGVMTPESVKTAMSEDVAGLMMTNPNTLGVFEHHAKEIADVLHDQGAFLYGDGANMNAFVGSVKPADYGFDVMHLNLHKTFSTPHGGGGPGAGPVAVCERLKPYLPTPRIQREEDGTYRVLHKMPHSIGLVKPYFGQFLILLRAWAYITLLGRDGLRETSEQAVLSARYIQSQLQDVFQNEDAAPCMHEAVFSDEVLKGTGVKTLDIAKALMDFGFHPPTMYFPLVVSGALLIEPTECEPKAELDRFIDVLKSLIGKAKENAEWFTDRPTQTPCSRINEALAARNLDVAKPI